MMNKRNKTKLMMTRVASLLALSGSLAISSMANAALQSNVGYTYYPNGQLETVDGPRTDVNDVTRYDYDGDGNLIGITNAAGHRTEFVDFNERGQPRSLRDENGHATELTYTPQGWLESVTRFGHSTRYTYDQIGQLEKVELPTGVWIDYHYDLAKRLKEVIHSTQGSIVYTHDVMGNVLSQSIRSPQGQLHQQRAYAYDELGRQIALINAASSHHAAYDPNGNVTIATDGNTNNTRNHHDALNRLVELTDAEGGITELAYDAHNNLTKVVAPNGATTTYFYNGLNQLIERNSADTGVTLYESDEAGNVVFQQDGRGVQAVYTYDELNRLTAVQYPANPQENIGYRYDDQPDATGKLTRTSNQSAVIDYHYHANGMISEQKSTLNLPGVTLESTVQYDVDDLGQTVGITYPNGMVVNARFDESSRISGIDLDLTALNGEFQALLSDVKYHPFGGVSGYQTATGLTYEQVLDLDGNITRLSTSGIFDYGYTYDGNGNLLTIDVGADVKGFDYDKLDRLTREDRDAILSVREYEYDANGNRTKWRREWNSGGWPKVETKTSQYADSTNQLLSFHGSTELLDEIGNHLAHKNDEQTHAYDLQGRRIKTTKEGIFEGHYFYNALGQRVYKRIDHSTYTTEVAFTYDLNGQLISERMYYDHTDRLKRERAYVWLYNKPVAVVVTGYNWYGEQQYVKIYDVHSDHLNTPRFLSDENQAIVWKWESDAFGLGSPDTDPDGDGNRVYFYLRFPGQYYDYESGLHYNYFRDYDPETGRYIQSDPIGLNGGLNTYGYVGGNPTGFVDPLGLLVWGQSYGGSIVKNGTTLSGSITLAIDHTGKFMVLTTPEYGFSTPGHGAFARIVHGMPFTTVDDLLDKGTSLSLSKGVFNLSITSPGIDSCLTMGEYGYDFGTETDVSKMFYEIGIGVDIGKGSKYQGSITHGYGLPIYENTVIPDAINDISNWFSELF
ncbi:RHS repeat protein [Corallincola luteus]|uniref:RHS repeat protein n=1 Tax=Corallincola luteus TaxID=1775177 RepID=A0ABY2APG9_9GAMM|nr:RHS repeat-associated core domain-containing protein [Corallincola luteus]TCI05100.1 RHS repeat protein [Corallincola luteus]